MDRFEESHVEAPVSLTAPSASDAPNDLLHANEAVSRFVAYAGPYLLWGTVAVIAVGIILLS